MYRDHRKILLRLDTQIMNYKRKNVKFDFSELKTCPLKGTVKKMKWQDTEWERIFAVDI